MSGEPHRLFVFCDLSITRVFLENNNNGRDGVGEDEGWAGTHASCGPLSMRGVLDCSAEARIANGPEKAVVLLL